MQGGVFQRSGVRGFERKIKEAIVAIQLEKRYTKREIFTFYANHVTMGHGAYGVEAGARLYFDKPAKDLTLEEAATIAAIIQTPARLSPFVNPDQALARRNNYVLPRMAEEGFITGEEADAAAARPLVVQGQPTPERSIAPVLRRRHPQDARAELTAPTRSTRPGSGADDARRRAAGGRQPRARPRPAADRQAAQRLPEAGAQRRRRKGTRSTASRPPRWSQPMLAGDIVPAVVTAVPARGGAAPASASARTSSICRASAFAWTRRTSAADLFKVGDLDRGRSRRSASDGVPQTVTLEQPPAARGRARRHRQPHRPDPRDGRRVQLRPQQVQPRDAGAAAAGLDLQADRLHDRDRSRLHAGLGLHRRAGVVRAGPEPAAVRAAELRPQVRGAGDAAPRARAVAQHSGREGDARSRAAAGRRLCGAVRPPRQLPAVPVAGARLRGSHAGRHDRAPTRCFPTRACG